MHENPISPAQLRAGRALLGLSQSELAQRAGVPVGAIARAETDGETDASEGDVTLTGNTALYSSTKNRVSRKISNLACAKAGLVGPLNGYTQLM
jgi:predicted transcriptional regulator